MSIFAAIDLRVFFVITALAAALAYEGGFRLGVFRHLRSRPAKSANLGTMVGSIFGLLAFMLAFTFGIAASHFDSRKTAVLEDTNAIRSVYLKAELLAEPHARRVRELLRDYVAARVEAPRIATAGELKAFAARAEELQALLWKEAMANESAAPAGGSSWLFVDKLDEMIAKHYNRVAIATRPRIPQTIWLVLFLVAMLSMAAAGYQSGSAGGRGSFVFLVSCVAFSLILVLIADLDRPRQSLFKISQQPLESLYVKMASVNQ